MHINKDRAKRLSKFLSFVLRHSPETIGVTLDENGWVNINFLILQMNNHKKTINKEILEFIVKQDSKQRFAFNSDRTLIRANQGHSIDINLNYQVKTIDEVPTTLYHGTAEHFAKKIMQTGGIQKMKRHHVHLSADIETASIVGRRHGQLVIFTVDTKAMIDNGHEFYQSDNGVWLTEDVPIQFIQIIKN